MTRLEQLQKAFETAEKVDVPRLKPGQGVKGCEPYGCFNTGIAWTLFRSPATKEYLVVRDLDRDRLRNLVLFHGYDHIRKFKLEHGSAWRFKTRAAAVKKFQDVNLEMHLSNIQEAIRHEKLRMKAQAGDLEAALTCGLDY
jgi:hypothetical protein